MSERFDAIVIGTGQAAPALCARLDKEGLKTALFERKLLGGTLRERRLHSHQDAGGERARRACRSARARSIGFAAGQIRVDMAAVKRRKDHVVKQSSDGVANWIAGMKHVTLIRGQARFVAPKPFQMAHVPSRRRRSSSMSALGRWCPTCRA